MMIAIMTFLETMPFWYWFILAGALALLELMTGSTYLLWPATAAIIVGLLAILPMGATWQFEVLIFVAVTGALTLYAAPRVKPWLHRARGDHPLLNERGARKVGRRAVVDQDFVNGVGQVKLDDTLWLAECASGSDLTAGTPTQIVHVEGAKLYVQKLL